MRDYSRSVVVAAVVVALLSACGGGSGSGGQTSANESDPQVGLFREFVAAHEGDADSGGAPTLSDTEKAEAAARSRRWAVETTFSANPAANTVTLPPLYFARAEAVAAAAFGTTLTQIRKKVPAPSSPAVAAALMRGISRTVSAAEDAPVTTAFMNAITADGQPGTWSHLTLKPLSLADLASERNLRLSIYDSYSADIAWPQATPFDGVFESDNGQRILSHMLKIVGPHRTMADGAMDVVALPAPHGRWFVRITPKGGLQSWAADDLDFALSKVAGELAAQASEPLTEGEIILPITSYFETLGIDDLRGMGEAQDRVRADLRGLDGQGGTYANLPDGYASLNMRTDGLTVSGDNAASFIFSPDNIFGGPYGIGVEWVNFSQAPCEVTDSRTDFKPSYFALINTVGGVDMLARLTSLSPIMCQATITFSQP